MPLPQSHPSSGPPWTLVCSLEAAPLKSEFRVLPRTNTSSLSHAVIRFIWIFSINFNPLLLDFHLDAVTGSLLDVFLWLDVTVDSQREDLGP